MIKIRQAIPVSTNSIWLMDNNAQSWPVTLPTVLRMEPLDSFKHPIVDIRVLDVANSESSKSDRPEFLIYGRLLSLPNDPEAKVEYNAFIQKMSKGESVDRDWHFCRWGTPAWFASLTGCSYDVVRMTVFNNLCKLYGGQEWYPLDLAKIIWVKPIATDIDQLYCLKDKTIPDFWAKKLAAAKVPSL